MTYPGTYGAVYGGTLPGPGIVLPQIIAEAGFVPDPPAGTAGVLILNDVTQGLLNTGVLGSSTTWTDISAYLISFTITRASTRLQGPVLQFQASTLSAVFDNSDGRFDPDNLGGPYVGAGLTQVIPMVPVRVRAIFGGVSYGLFCGYADGWLETAVDYEAGYSEVTLTATDGFKILAGVNLPAIGAVGAGELSGARVNRILGAAGWYAATNRQVAAGNSAVQATTYGADALSLLQLTSDSEIGQLYINGSGVLVFRNRQALLTDSRSNTPQAVFGDLPDNVTELAYAQIGRADDDTTLANLIQATRAGGTEQDATDAASVSRYLFPRTYTRSDLLLQSDAEALQWAQWVLHISSTVEDRFDTLAIDPQADPGSLWPQVLGRDMGDRITVIKRPGWGVAGAAPAAGQVTSPAAFQNILFVTVAPGTWTVSWTVTLAGTLSSADVNNFGLYNGTTFVAGSINPAAAGTYPQAPVTFTVTSGAPDIKILSAGNTPTAGAVYGAALPSPVIKDVFISGITCTWVTAGSDWLTTWTLQGADKYGGFLTLGNVTLGKLSAGNALAY